MNLKFLPFSTAKDDEVVHLRRRVAQLEAELRKHRMYFGGGSFLTHGPVAMPWDVLAPPLSKSQD